RTTAGLFGWLRRHCKVKWAKGGNFASQAELFAEIERTAHCYKAIELFPHEPPIAGIYYRGGTPELGDGSHLRQLIGRFRRGKPMRLRWAELEAMITSPVISGKQMYVGEGQRPNLLTWYITLNGVNMATDMAQRSVIIKVVRGRNSGRWWEHTLRFIDEHREE